MLNKEPGPIQTWARTMSYPTRRHTRLMALSPSMADEDEIKLFVKKKSKKKLNAFQGRDSRWMMIILLVQHDTGNV